VAFVATYCKQEGFAHKRRTPMGKFKILKFTKVYDKKFARNRKKTDFLIFYKIKPQTNETIPKIS
jgi:hypothetical protein